MNRTGGPFYLNWGWPEGVAGLKNWLQGNQAANNDLDQAIPPLTKRFTGWSKGQKFWEWKGLNITKFLFKVQSRILICTDFFEKYITLHKLRVALHIIMSCRPVYSFSAELNLTGQDRGNTLGTSQLLHWLNCLDKIVDSKLGICCGHLGCWCTCEFHCGLSRAEKRARSWVADIYSHQYT